MNTINRIVLVGNGFDLAHDLPTRYENFINWYWEKWIRRLRLCYTNTDSDTLCTFTIHSKRNTWAYLCSIIINPLSPPSGEYFYNYLKNNKEEVTITHSSFMHRICQSIEKKGWVDIENEYYHALNDEYHDNPEALNNEFNILRDNLIEYLALVQKMNIKASVISQKLKHKILAPIKENEIAINARPLFVKFVDSRISDIDYWWNVSIYDRFESNTSKKNKALIKFLKEYKDQIEHMGIDSIIGNNCIPKELLYPNRLMLLNFNYTNTADLYIPRNEDNEYWFLINHIHGTLSDPNSIVFGYGDELDDNYQGIVKLNNNEHLRYIKSIKYLEAQNYRNMLEFIESAPYQVYIMGHSCGNSDRTLLNTLFEHKNCISIKPFYHLRDNGTDNYLELIQNISRNFTDMKLMRDRVVNKMFCEPI